MSGYRLTRRGERVRAAALLLGSALIGLAFCGLFAVVLVAWWFTP